MIATQDGDGGSFYFTGDMHNDGILELQDGHAGDDTYVDGNYSGSGVLTVDTYFGQNPIYLAPTITSPPVQDSDALHVDGSTINSDETTIEVTNVGGIGDFTGSAGKPTPMEPHEVQRIVTASRGDETGESPVKTAIPFKVGDRVRVKEGYFENFEGEVEAIDEANGRVTVMINIFGRSTPVELEHWQVESV